MEKLDSVLFYYIEKAIKSYRQFAQRELKKAGLNITVDQWLTLNCLAENPKINQKELSEKVFKDTASVTRIIELLVKAKYLKRNVNKNDRRTFDLTITESGLQLMNAASGVVNGYRKTALKGIGIAKEEHVKMVMKSIIKNCQEN